MTSIVIREKVSVDAASLDAAYRKHILDKMKLRFEKTCTNASGYIMSINEIVEIHSNSISSGDSMAVFDVSFSAVVLKPKVNEDIKGKVSLVESYGLLVHIHDKLQILIPSGNLGKFVYSEEESIYTQGNKSIKVDTTLEVTITKVKYEKKKYSCIGSLKRVCQE